jgi:hypothetical protein
VVLLLAAGVAFGQTISIEEYSPRSLLVVPEHRVTRAKYPFVDIHNHQRGGSPEQVDRLVKDMDELNMRIRVNLSGGYGDLLKQIVQALKSRYPDREVPRDPLGCGGRTSPAGEPPLPAQDS